MAGFHLLLRVQLRSHSVPDQETTGMNDFPGTEGAPANYDNKNQTETWWGDISLGEYTLFIAACARLHFIHVRSFSPTLRRGTMLRVRSHICTEV